LFVSFFFAFSAAYTFSSVVPRLKDRPFRHSYRFGRAFFYHDLLFNVPSPLLDFSPTVPSNLSKPLCSLLCYHRGFGLFLAFFHPWLGESFPAEIVLFGVLLRCRRFYSFPVKLFPSMKYFCFFLPYNPLLIALPPFWLPLSSSVSSIVSCHFPPPRFFCNDRYTESNLRFSCSLLTPTIDLFHLPDSGAHISASLIPPLVIPPLTFPPKLRFVFSPVSFPPEQLTSGLGSLDRFPGLQFSQQPPCEGEISAPRGLTAI